MSTIHTNHVPTFHLGLTMAGAVSAGCYSAGVIDYLFEILDLWEQAKHGKVKLRGEETEYEFDKKLIPQHRVIIDAMGGASAGGMTTMMTALYALSDSVNPVKKPLGNVYENKNILYDSWVHLNDQGNNKTFDELWDLNDLKDDKLFSLLNSKPIDDIANRAYSYYPQNGIGEQVNALPSYISKELEILLSHTVLRGIPLEVDFSTFKNQIAHSIELGKEDQHELTENQLEILKELEFEYGKYKPTHTSYEHALISHFKLNGGKQLPNQKNFWLNPNDEFERKRMMNATIATGAFPVGLKFRKLSKEFYSEEYIKSILKRSIFSDFGKEDPDVDHKLLFDGFPKDYESLTIDGGAVNNEPYSEVTSIVRERAAADKSNGINYGMVMIDPFPDMVDSALKYTEETDLIDVIPSILGTLTDQSKLKRKEMIDNLSDTYVKGQIYPRRHYYDGQGNYVKSEDFPIASASFSAFGGFLDNSFRVHDFFLGRDNARNFFRYFFSLPYSKENPHPIHQDWTEEMINVFGFVNDADKQFYLPIIPDLNLLIIHGFTTELTIEQKSKIETNKFNFSGIEKNVYSVAERPKFDPKNLFRIEKQIQKRIKKILEVAKKRVVDTEENPIAETTETAREYALWLKENRFNTRWRRIKSFFTGKLINSVFWWTKGPLSKTLTEATIKMIIKDLIDKNLLSKSK